MKTITGDCIDYQRTAGQYITEKRQDGQRRSFRRDFKQYRDDGVPESVATTFRFIPVGVNSINSFNLKKKTDKQKKLEAAVLSGSDLNAFHFFYFPTETCSWGRSKERRRKAPSRWWTKNSPYFFNRNSRSEVESLFSRFDRLIISL